MNTLRKKLLALALIGIAGLAFAGSESVGRATTMMADPSNAAVSSVNYNAWAKTTAGASAPSTNAPVWKIVRTTVDAAGLVTEVKNAYGSGSDPLWSTAYTNRVAATYK